MLVIQKNPDDLATLRQLALTYSARGDFDDAFVLLQVNKSADANLKALKKDCKKWDLITAMNGA